MQVTCRVRRVSHWRTSAFGGSNMAIDPRNGFLTLSDNALVALDIPVSEVCDVVEAAVLGSAEGRVHTTPKSAIVPGTGRYMMTTLSTADDPGRTVVKSVMVSPRNPARGLQATEGVIIVQDSETGRLLAVMEAGWVTAVRTAALSAVAAKRLANPNSTTIGFVGAGVQSRSHLSAMADLFPLKRVHIFSRGMANMERLRDYARGMGLDAVICDGPEQALRHSDIVVSSVTLSFEMEPFLDANWLKPGAFAAITDAAGPWFPASIDRFGAICIDDLEQERTTPNPMVPLDLVGTDLPGLVAGHVKMGFDPDKPSAFIFRGMAVGDFAVAAMALEKAQAAGIGTAANW